MTEPILPLRLLWSVNRANPDLWRDIDALRADRRWAQRDWPDYIYAPQDASYRALGYGPGCGRVSEDVVRAAALCTALAAWRPTQSIYRFDETLKAALLDTPLNDVVPVDWLRRMPEWCVCLELEADREYAFVHLDTGVEIPGHTEEALRVFRISLDAEGDIVDVPAALGLNGTFSEECRRSARVTGEYFHGSAPEEAVAAHAQVLAERMRPVLALALYLCVDDPDLREERGTGKQPAKPVPKTTKKRPTPFVQGASGPTVYEMGYRIGAALRKSREEVARSVPQGGTHRSPVPHWRGAHYHTVLSGPRDKERVRTRKWFPPIPVNIRDADAVVPVVRPVKP